MGKEIGIVRPKNNELIFDDSTVRPSNVLGSIIHNQFERGWDFANGDPEKWKFKEKLLVPGGKLLDLGIGVGSNSIFFALQGMSVTGYEIDQDSIAVLRATAEAFDLPIEVRNEDFMYAKIEKDAYDTVLLGQSLVHVPSRQYAFDALDKAIQSTKPGGYIWLRAAGKHDSTYEQFNTSADYDPMVRKLDEDTFEAPCGCTGELEVVPHLFLPPIETVGFFADRGMYVEHTQIISEPWGRNIMYGEDWNRGQPSPREGGFITILAQKPKR